MSHSHSKGKVSFDKAWHKISRTLKHIKHDGATEVYEVTSYPLNNLDNLQRLVKELPIRSVGWQHTDAWHTATIYIPKGTGFWYSRNILDLIDGGFGNKDKFKELWEEKNGDSYYGYFPKIPTSTTNNIRLQQSSYIVCDKAQPPNPQSKIPGEISDGFVDRTHLISSRVTGIENHKGLLIDFDGWLNKNPLNRFETWALQRTFRQDIIWYVQIWKSNDGLHWKYIMYDNNFDKLKELECVDDRWSYLWFYDPGQDRFSRKALYTK
ncbi:hypothetical protein [uncultured Lactobacillus sp.]|uniref:hypothetical protein n=1 Tax=uncultured Lactobacillus sp. TaxID=153152 RepID=UPI0025D3ACE1|nr:hypothetical protein [uncultured Lactobacillus sp.]